MDKNIEIRANANYPILTEGNPENRIRNAQFNAYCKGAADQKETDIKRACRWFCKTCPLTHCNIGDECIRYIRFKKALED